MFGQPASRRCSMCGINYPADQAACDVDGCTETLRFNPYTPPDEDWREKVRVMNEAQEDGGRPDPDGLRAHRVRCYERLGFEPWAAELLADAQDALGVALYWGNVDKALSEGMTHVQAVSIFV